MEEERELTRQLQNHCKDDDGDAGAPPSVTEPNTSALHFSLEVSAMEKEGVSWENLCSSLPSIIMSTLSGVQG